MTIKKEKFALLLILFVLGCLAALPALAGVKEGNSGSTGRPMDVKKFVRPGQNHHYRFLQPFLRTLHEAGPDARFHGGQTSQDAGGKIQH